MITKPKKISISKLKQKADKVFSLFIRDRDGYKCTTCGKEGTKGEIDAGHYISRDITPLRYDERNVNAQCKGCNIFKKGNMAVYAIKMMEKHGDNILFDLDETVKDYKKGNKKYGAEFYQEIIKKYG